MSTYTASAIAVPHPSTFPRDAQWIDKLVGQGTYCQVYLIGPDVVEKRPIDAGDPKTRRDLKHEALILRKIDHVNVVSLIDERPSGIVIEFAGECLIDLMHRIGSFGDTIVRDGIAIQIMSAVSHIHSRNVWHLDLKVDNMGIDASGKLQIFDFGLAYDVAAAMHSPENVPPGARGTMQYAAPEVLAQKPYDGFLADTWSVGICIFCLTYGFFPFARAHASDPAYSIAAACKSIPLAAIEMRKGLHVTNLIHWLDGMLAPKEKRRHVSCFLYF